MKRRHPSIFHGGRILTAAALFLSLSARAEEAPQGWTLDDCYKKALAVDETLAVSDEDINRAEAQYRQLRGTVLPRIGFMGTEFYQDTTGVPAPSSSGGTFTAHHRPQYNFYATQPIFSGFREFAGLKAAGAVSEARKDDRARASQLLYQDVAAAFYTVVELDQQLLVLAVLEKSTQDRTRELLDRVRVGRSRQSELMAANSQLASIEAQIQDARGQWASALELLSFLTGARVAEVRDAMPDPDSLEPVDVFLKKMPGRPDLLSQEALTRSSDFSLTAARRDIWPTLGVGANYYTHRVGINQPIDWDVTFTLDAPIFRGGQWKASVDDAAAARRSQTAVAARALRSAERDVRDIHAQLSALEAEMKKLSEAAKLAEDSYNAQVKEYRLGIVNNLDVITALSAWEQTKLDYDHKRLEAKVLAVRLAVATGDVK